MDHSEAVQQMAAERYLLDELTPELRDAFEEHVFDCQECAFDLRAEAVFIEEAKAELPKLYPRKMAPPSPAEAKTGAKKSNWFFWWQPAFAFPAFAALLAVIAYQNFSMIPALQSAANEPRLVPSASLHAGTRGTAPTAVPADRKQGAGVAIELPRDSAYSSYVFDLYDPQNRHFWTRTVTASNDRDTDGTLSLSIPGAGLQQGSYTLAITGVTSQGGRTEIDRRVLDIHFDD
jgi:hypothetical protein